MRSIRERSVRKATYARTPEKERNPRAIVRGVFHDDAQKPEFTALYQQLIDRLREESSARDADGSI